jgi:hypothetical protein
VDPGDIEPTVTAPFTISRSDKIATAGSCFAQHIAKRLKQSGYTYFVTEDAPPGVSPEILTRFNYGVFSARYGNIYTARQLLQLLRRVRGQWEPAEAPWHSEGRWLDPFRPFIQPRGFASEAELSQDRQQHNLAILNMLESADIFVFTMGLTEAWRSKIDGAVFPGCPGCSAGEFDSDKYEFYNADYEDIIADMRMFISEVREINPDLKFIFTVSPVPLIATATEDHVLTATTYSKSVLRAVAGKLASEHRGVSYFPSYEIITCQANRGRYYAPDLRSVLETGVDHVMRVFFNTFCGSSGQKSPGEKLVSIGSAPSPKRVSESDREERDFLAAASLVCDEERLVATQRARA